MELLEIFTFGRLAIHLGGKLVTGFHSQKAAALLVYLVANPIPHPRTKLAEMLWEERSHTQGLSNLRVLIANLRKLLGSYLIITRKSIGINPDANWEYDAACFEELLVKDEIEPAMELYQGDFLEGFYITGGRDFENWQLERCTYYQQQVQSSLRKQIKRLTHQGQYELAVQQARQLSAFDPYDESTQMTLMRLLAATHQPGLALRQYQLYRQTLIEEIAAQPSAEITALFQQIQSGQTVNPPFDENRSPNLPAYLQANRDPSFIAADIFVGRERELIQLSGFLSQALERKGGMVFVTGDAGSGKTSLVREFARSAQATHKNLLTVMGHCHLFTGSGNPLGPMREVLDMLTGDIETRWISGSITNQQARQLWHYLPSTIETLAEDAPVLVGTLLPLKTLIHRVEAAGLRTELGQTLAVFNQHKTTIHQQDFIFQQYVDFLITVSRDHPLIVILEDLQWADPSTIDLLSYLASHLPESRILVIGTYRPADLPSQPDTKPGLRTIYREFKRQFGNIWIDLDQREPGEDVAFIRALLQTKSQRFNKDFVQRLARHTGGHPLFVVELLKNLQLQDRLLSSTSNSSGIDWSNLPARVEAVIEMRLARLDHQSCNILKAASVVGEEFVTEVVARVLGKNKELIYQTVDTLVKDHALLTEQGIKSLSHQRMTTLRFRHLLFQRYVYTNLNKIEKKGLHEKVGLALESFYTSELDKPNDLSLQLSHHFIEAGMNIKASTYLLETGNRAVQMGAHAEAIQHFQKGLDLLKAVPQTQECLQQEISLSLAMYSPLQALRGYSDPQLEILGQKIKNLCEEVNAENPLLSTLYFLRVTHKTSQERDVALQKASQILDDANQTDSLLRSLAHWTLGAEMSYQGDFLPARTHLEQTKNLYRSQENPWSVFLFGHDPGIASRARLAWVLWFLGYPDQAIVESQQALALAQQLDHPVVLGFAIGIGGVLFNQIRRDVNAAKEWNLQSIQHSENEQMQLFNPGETISRGWVLTQTGRIAEGLKMMERGLDAWQQSNATRHYTQYLGMLAEGHTLAGQIDKALSTFQEGLAAVESSQERYFEAELHRLTGDTLLKRSGNNDDQAEACYQDAIRVAQAQHAKSWELRATTSLCRLWYQQERQSEAYQHLSEIYNWFAEGFNSSDLIAARELLGKIKQ